MKQPLAPHKQDQLSPSHPVNRISLRRRIEAQISVLPQRLFGIKRNSFKIRLSNRFMLLLMRKGISLKSSASEIQAMLENILLAPLSRLISCGQLTFGDVLVIRTNEKNNEIEIERLSGRKQKSNSKASHTSQILL
jgi:ATP-dependent Clp protease ATP-binding subunit ClpA